MPGLKSLSSFVQQAENMTDGKTEESCNGKSIGKTRSNDTNDIPAHPRSLSVWGGNSIPSPLFGVTLQPLSRRLTRQSRSVPRVAYKVWNYEGPAGAKQVS